MHYYYTSYKTSQKATLLSFIAIISWAIHPPEKLIIMTVLTSAGVLPGFLGGPLSKLPPDPLWSHHGGAQPGLQWQLWLLLHSWEIKKTHKKTTMTAMANYCPEKNYAVFQIQMQGLSF